MEIFISKDNCTHDFCPDNKPVATANSGDTIIFETMDATCDMLKSDKDTIQSLGLTKFNPATGPVYITDAKPGDTLKVEIQKIELAKAGWMHGSNVFGAMADNLPYSKAKIFTIKDGFVDFDDKIIVPINPMIGVIGTAPADEKISTDYPGFHGGNMDCKYINEGATIYLPISVDGGLFSLGDLHAIQGDGETIGNGIEIAGKVTVKITVLTDVEYPTPLLINDGKAMVIYSDESLDIAADNAVKASHKFLYEQVGIEKFDAAMMLSALGDIRICQIVDPKKTARMEFPLSLVEKHGFKFK